MIHNETITNIYWGLFLIWFGSVAALDHGNLLVATDGGLWGGIFALGTGGLLVLMNLTRVMLRLKLSVLTIGLGVLLMVIYGPSVLFSFSVPFLPAIIVIAGIALVIGAFRTRNFRAC